MKAMKLQEDAVKKRGIMSWEDAPDPQPKEDEVIVDVVAAGVNRADLLQCLGRYPAPSWAPQGLGMEVSGIISAVGSAVTEWKIGDRVASLIEGGGYAEKVPIPAGYLLPVPKERNLVEAAALPEAFLTAFINIYVEGEAKEGEVVLVHAAASGVGTAALQLCQLFKNPAFATASGGKLEQILPYQPVQAINRETESFYDVIAGSQYGGVDVILDLVGGSYFEDNIKSLKSRGRLVNIGLLGGNKGTLRLDQLLTRRLRIVGSVLRGRSKAEKYPLIKEFRTRVWPFYEDGKITPHIDEIYPIEQAEEAHERLRTNSTVGKILLKVDSRNA